MPENFKGYLQTGGYVVYEKYSPKAQVTHLACWAHARRVFEKALGTIPQEHKRPY
ncbi:transposase [Leadbetterella sp. DM7]|uniref:IS66 family transposase n=1 Tax=Leadbetterella sp. DM7 TaxID=3235085 RepID=UPI00349EBF92